jgi:hypothetical protein
VRTASDLDPGTWLVVEVDGAIAVNLATTFGYDFSWVRETELGELKGDIGLKLQLGLAASVGFTARSRVAVVVSAARERGERDQRNDGKRSFHTVCPKTRLMMLRAAGPSSVSPCASEPL